MRFSLASLILRFADEPAHTKNRIGISTACPSIVLLDLALAFNCPTNRADRLHRLLRLNPALLLFALNQYQNSAKTPADSANRLIVWCEEHLLPAILNSDLLPCAMNPAVNPQTNKKNRQMPENAG